MKNEEKLFKLADRLDKLAQKVPADDLAALEESANQYAKAWSGSALGYHSRVYYKDFSTPPPGANFSKEWGLMDSYPMRKTRGDWVECDYEETLNRILQENDEVNIDHLEKESNTIKEEFDEIKSELSSILTIVLENHPADRFLTQISEAIDKEEVISFDDYKQAILHSGQTMTRDSEAAQSGHQLAPHLFVLCDVVTIRGTYNACANLSKFTRRAASHLENLSKEQVKSERIGTNVFIGHGRSNLWKELKDFIQDRLNLPWDEFNRVPVAGFTNIARLSEMLDSAAIGFIVLTAEDEQADGRMHARMNVIHEAGLFQGRLGFAKAILLLEQGCEEFSNVQGLGQIRFPKGDISAKFEEIRLVLEREGIIVT